MMLHKRRMLFFNIIIPAIAGIMIFIYLYYGRSGKIPSLKDDLIYYLYSMGIGILIGLSMLYIDEFFKRYWDKQLNISRLITLQLTAKIIFAFLLLSLMVFLLIVVIQGVSLSSLLNSYYDEIIKLLILFGGSMLFYSLIAFALQSYNYYSFYKIERIRNEREQLSLQFDALKSQLSPHYLFNCLNTISSLIHKNAQQSEDFIRRMAKTFQYVLENDEKQLVKISEELEFVKAYNYLLKVRFEDQLVIYIDIPKHIQNGLIPPLTIQMLLENAVKHNVIDEHNKLRFTISTSEDGALVVENTKTESPVSNESFHIGLENIKNRYAYLCGQNIKITDAKNKYSVKLPVIMNNPVYHE